MTRGLVRLQAGALEGLRTTRTVIWRLLPNRRATTSTEYALLLMLIVVGAIAIFALIGSDTDRLAQTSVTSVGTIATGQNGVVVVDAPDHPTREVTSGPLAD